MVRRFGQQASPTNMLLTYLFLLGLLVRSALGAPAVVTIVDFTSWSFRGEIAGFANPLDEDYAYASNLMTPPDDARMCEFPPSLLDSNNETIQIELRTPVALLISLGGGCNPIDKVNIALRIQREVSNAVRYLVFYNNNPDDPDDIPSLRESDFYEKEDDYQSLAVVAVSTTVGSAMLGRIGQLKDVTGANPQFLAKGNHRWQLPMVLELISDRYPTRGGYSPNQSASASASFYWFRFVLFTLLIISPCCRAGYLWWAGGGRIRWRRNENGRIIGLQYIPPMTYWFASNGGPDGGPQVSERLTEEEVLALPEITYKTPKEDDDGNKGGSDGFTVDSQAMDSGDDQDEEIDIVVSAGSDDSGKKCEAVVVDGPAEEDPSISSNPLQSTPNEDREYSTMCTSCSICIDEFEEGERIRLLPRCNHAFHTECIMQWLTERQGCCPNCKVSVIEQPNEGESQDEAPAEREDTTEELAGGNDDERTYIVSAPLQAEDSDETQTANIEPTESVEVECGRDGPVSTDPVEEIRLTTSPLPAENDPDPVEQNGIRLSAAPVSAENDPEKPSDGDMASETDAASVPAESLANNAPDDVSVDTVSVKEAEKVEDDAAPTEGHEEESDRLESNNTGKHLQSYPFDEHPLDESDPSMMDVPFDERPRGAEASEAVWLKAVGEQKSEGESSKSLTP